jgi:hypothetical protein
MVIKEKTVDIIGWEYLTKRDEYVLTFRISGFKPESRETIFERHESGILNS